MLKSSPKLFFVVPLLALALDLGISPLQAEPLLKAGDKAERFGLKMLLDTKNEGRIFLTDYVTPEAQKPAKLLLLGFFASWCAPCKAEFPELIRFANSYRERGLSLLVVNIDREEEGRKAAAGFLAPLAPPFPVLSDHLNLVVRRYFDTNINLPAAFLIDREGTVLEVFLGSDSAPKIEAALAARLGRPMESVAKKEETAKKEPVAPALAAPAAKPGPAPAATAKETSGAPSGKKEPTAPTAPTPPSTPHPG